MPLWKSANQISPGSSVTRDDREMTIQVRSYSKLQIWLLAARPKTLPAAATPVIIAGALALTNGVFHLLSFMAALLGGLLIQIGTNYANDLYDFKKSVDTHTRLGPLRVTQAGLVTESQMRAATVVVFSLAVLVGIYLVLRGGLPILIVGLTSIFCGVIYTAGPYPLGYIGLGELFVLIFFGFVPVAGSYYAMSLRINAEVILAGMAPGLLSVAILVVNNLRDIDTDRTTGKRTLAVRFGRQFARAEYVSTVVAAGLFPIAHFLTFRTHAWSMLACVILVAAIPLIRTVLTTTDGSKLNGTLAGTGRLLLLFGLLFSLGRLL
jgi:1,4-dihydroxy-2-naphthoate polyprenyltransferase